MDRNAKEDGGLDREVDNAEGFYFFGGGEERYEESGNPLCIQAYSHADAVDVRVTKEAARLAAGAHFADTARWFSDCVSVVSVK